MNKNLYFNFQVVLLLKHYCERGDCLRYLYVGKSPKISNLT